jgi:hypothetical protein
MEPSIPFYKSQVLIGIIVSVILKIIWAWFKWAPPVDFDVAELVKELSILASFIGDAIAAHGRVTATLQPVTLFDENK